MNSDNQQELDWLAFRYVHGELPAGEAEAFEARLAGDLAACEAVSCVVRLTDALKHSVLTPSSLAPSALTRTGEPVVRMPRRLTKKSLMSVFVVAAGLLIAVSLWQLAQSDVRASRLAVAWSDLLVSLSSDPDDQADHDAADHEDADSDSLNSSGLAEPANGNGSAADAEIAPPWLMAAVEYEIEARDMSTVEPASQAPLTEPVLENET